MAQGEFAFVGNELVPTNETPYVIVDEGATTTLTSSFKNCTDIKPKKVDIHLAEGGVAMVTTHVCLKTNYFRSRTGECRAVTTLSQVCGQTFYQSSYLTSKVIVSSITLTPRNQSQLIEGKMDKSKSFAFMSEHSNRFCLKPEMLTTQQLDKMSGFEKWHRRLGHVSIRDIQQSIPYTKGLEELTNRTYMSSTQNVQLV